MNSTPTGGGPVNGSTAKPRAQAQRQLFTVEDALQRTPLTSINPFDPEIIPIPEAVPPVLNATLLSNNERSSAKAQLQHLDATVQKSGSLSQDVAPYLQDLPFLLKDTRFKQYHFESLPPHSNHGRTPSQNATPQGPSRSQAQVPRLGSFAQCLLNSGAFNSTFSYSSPSSTKERPAVHDPSSPKIRRNSSHFTPQQANKRMVSHNARITVPSPVPPSGSPSATSPGRKPVVMIPTPSRDDVRFLPHDPKGDEELLRQARATEVEKQRRSENANEILRDIDIGQRDKARAALQNVQEALSVVFDAEERLSIDGLVSSATQSYFESSPDSSGFVLTKSALAAIDASLAKAISTKQAVHVPVESLVRLQRLCFRTVVAATEDDLIFPDDLSDDSLQKWASSVSTAEHTISASRLLLRTMTAGRSDKELFSEETLSELLSNFRKITDGCIAPVVEARTSSDNGQRISNIDSLKNSLTVVVQRAGRTLKLLGELLMSSEISEMAATTIDYICMQLTFLSNASSDKDSVLGVQKFETLRRNAMDCLARVFLRYPAQRRSILDEILSSLEKLPVARQSARHYRVNDGRPIQLVSALIMQLIQITATSIATKARRSKFLQSQPASDAEGDKQAPERSSIKRTPAEQDATNGVTGLRESDDAVDALAKVGKPLWLNVQNNASYVAQYLVARALKSSKSSDEPYRNLLDIFTEDFISVLGHADWPAAELILQYLLRQLISIADNEKAGAPAKNMALDLMGIMGSGIADLQTNFVHSLSSLSTSEESQAQELAATCRGYLEGEGSEAMLLSIHGPYRLVTDFLDSRAGDEVQLQNARNFHLLKWSQRLCLRGQSPATGVSDEKEHLQQLSPSGEVAEQLLNAIENPTQAIAESTQVSTSIARTAYVLLVLQMAFCKAILRVFQTLLQSMASVHATIRSRGLKSVFQLLEKDPSILDHNTNIVAHISRAANDQSTMVRDAALSLIGKCVAIRPQIELAFLEIVLTLSSDITLGIRKRAIPHLRQAYLRNTGDDTRLRVASALLARMNDEEESIKEITRDTLEEIWIRPYTEIVSDNIPLMVQQDLNTHAAQLVAVAEQGESTLFAFEPFFRGLLIPSHKNAANNRGVCRAIAGAAFDSFLENDQHKTLDARANILSLLSVLVRANPTLLSIDQLKMLETYTSTLKTGADLRLYKPVAQIYRAAMPCFAVSEKDFVVQLQRNFVKNLSLIPIDHPDLMDEVTGCLWVMVKFLDNRLSLMRTTQSILKGIKESHNGDVKRTAKFIRMAGYFGKAWNLDDHAATFRQAFPQWTGEHVSELIIQTLLVTADVEHPADIRQLALEGIGLTCLSWPDSYLRKDVTDALEAALGSQDPGLERVIVSGLRDFFKAGESQAKPSSQVNGVAASGDTTEKLGASMVSSDGDKAATALAQRFFDRILQLALRYVDETAVGATELICSANRQGLVHPRLCVSVLVALETSPNESIAKTAYEEHLSLNSKHESILEKEYLKAVEQAFLYQRDTIKDSIGLRLEPTTSPKLRLFFEVLKTSSIATRKRLLPNLCKRLDINLSKLDSLATLENHLLFAKFVCQNLGFASYGRVDEIVTICSTLESIFGTTGNALSQSLEPILSAVDGINVPAEVLSQLTIAAMLLTLLWRTRLHLRQLYTNLPIPNGKQDKRISKDTSKPPVKSTQAPKLEDSFLKSTEAVGVLREPDAMRDACSVFIDLLSVDHEAKIVDSSDEMNGANGRDVTPEEGSMGTPILPPNGAAQTPRKKRRRVDTESGGTTPNGRKRGRPALDRRRSSAKKDPDEDSWC